MNFDLQPTTEPGRRFFALAEEHAADFATRADQHDRDGSFPFENIEALQKSGYMAAPVPEEFGGMGLTAISDFMIGMSRLARGCASTAIASNMHITGGFVMTRLRKSALATSDERMIGALEGLLRVVGAGQIVMCFPNTEPGTDLTAPMTEATPVEGGYKLNGHKIFGTLSPVAGIFLPNARILREDGTYGVANITVPKGTPGMEVLDNWDAMGMRASGSNDVVFKDCFVPEASVFMQDSSRWGELNSQFIEIALGGNMSLVACFLGIAEAAHATAVAAVTGRRKGPKARRLADRLPIQQLIAENEIDLAACRAIVERTGRLADQYLAAYLPGEAPLDESNRMMMEFQSMKWVVNHRAIDIVDRAMTVTGGGAFMSKHPLSRLYRDVRAGPFMQPFAPYEALEYVGKVALGIDPVIDR